MKRMINVISRETNDSVVHVNDNGSLNMAVFISHASVVQIQGNITEVVRYVRVDNELIIYFQDGSVIKLRNYFGDSEKESELVFDSEGELSHVTFDEVDMVNADLTPVELVANTSEIESIAPFFEQGWDLEISSAAALFAGVGGYMLSNDKYSSWDGEITGTTNAPTFFVIDEQGHQQGVLVDGAMTDDNTPTFSGTGEPGATIQIKDAAGNTIASTTIDEAGKWSVTLPEQADGSHSWSVVQINGSQVTEAGDISIIISSDVANISLNPLSDDNLINYKELLEGLPLTGQTEGLAAGTILTVTCNGKTYETTVADDGSWSVLIPTNDSQLITDGTITVTINGQDAVGNQISNSQDYKVDTIASDLTINTITTNDILNIIEKGQALVISGTCSKIDAGQTVTLELNGKTYKGIVGADGIWSATVPATDVGALVDGSLDVKATVEDIAGNIANADQNIIVKTTPSKLHINDMAVDNILNAIEQGQNLTISGSSLGFEVGTVVSITLNNKTYTTKIGDDGAWSLDISSVDLAALANTNYLVAATATDTIGNIVTIQGNLLVDTTSPVVIIDTFAGNDIVNAAEAMAGQTLSGRVSNVKAGSIVEIMFGGNSHAAIVQDDLTWSIDISPAELSGFGSGNMNISASVINEQGNQASSSRDVIFDNKPPVVTIDPVTGDNVLNSTELSQVQMISGSATGAEEGAKVVVTIGNLQYTTIVNAEGLWSVALPASRTIIAPGGKFTVEVIVTDLAGNSGKAEQEVAVDTISSGLTINQIAEDGVLNAIEKGETLTITGRGDGFNENTILKLTINSKDYFTTIDSSGNWSLALLPLDLAGLGNSSYVITASAVNSVGNATTVQESLVVDTSLPTVIIDTVAGNDIVNAAEVAAGQTITGRVSNAATGDIVYIMLGGVEYEAIVQDDLTWSFNVTPQEFTALGDGSITLSASVTNGRGNTGSIEHDIAIDAKIPGLRINTIAGDDVINALEMGQTLFLSGSSTHLAAGRSINIRINGKVYGATIMNDGSWQTGISATDVSAWPEGPLDVVVDGLSDAGTEVSITAPVIVDLSPLAISIDPVTSDNVINTLEHGQALTLSGKTSGVEAGQVVTITLNGQKYTAIVDADGKWSVTVPADKISALKEGDNVVQVSVNNVNGNNTQATQEFEVDTIAPTLTINPIATDDIINAAEQGLDLVIGGRCDAKEGQDVTILFNNKDYTVKVDATGNWTVTVPAADLASLNEGNITVEARVADDAGNETVVGRDITVDVTAPVVVIDTIADDDTLNATESKQALVINGTADGVAEGTLVVVSFNGRDFTTVVGAGGVWSVGIPRTVVSAVGDSVFTVTATVVDSAGNMGSADKILTINTVPSTITIGTLAGDDVLNAVEKGTALTVSGTSVGLSAGTQITIKLNGKDYAATVDASGNWTTDVSASDLSGLANTGYTITATATDDIGNIANTSTELVVDAVKPTVIINTIAGDNIINSSEVETGQTIKGRVVDAAAGDTVTVTVGSNIYTTIVLDDLSWSINLTKADLEAFGDGARAVNVSVSNANGNTGSADSSFTIDAALPSLHVNTVSGDDVINIIENKQDLAVTGSSTNILEGSSITVTINGIDYVTSVAAGGGWQIGVTAVELSAWPEGSIDIVVTGQSSSGNSVTETHTVIVDLTPVAISIDTIAIDDVINAAEKGQALTLSGVTYGVEDGQTVTVTLNGKTYSTTVSSTDNIDGTWTFNVPSADVGVLVDGTASVGVTVSNTSGNAAAAAQEVIIDSVGPSIIINDVAVDNVLNLIEQGKPLIVDGTTNAEAGQELTVTLNGVSYTTTVDGNGFWSVAFSTDDLASLTNGDVTIIASVADKAGNNGSANHTLTVDITPPTLTIATVAGDDVINAIELNQDVTINGTATGVTEGTLVKVTFGGQTFVTAVDNLGNWTIGVPASFMSKLTDGTLPIVASVVDVAGNTGTVTHNVEVNTAPGTITINDIAVDNVLNAVEKGQDLTISGGSSGLSAGTQVTIKLNNKDYIATVDSEGKWSVTILPVDLVGLGDVSYIVTASATNENGNSASAENILLVDTKLPTVTINTVASDDIINSTEVESAVTISGGVTNAKVGDTVTILLGGKTYTATVQSGLSWSVSVPSAIWKAIGDGDLTIKASVTNEHGNTGAIERDITVDANLPSLRVNTVSGDDIINSIEAEHALIVTGFSNGIAVGSIIDLVINGKNYTANILADGTWQAPVAAEDVAAWGAGSLSIEVSGQSTAGNAVNISHLITIDKSDVAISVNTITADNIINAAEKAVGLSLSGETRNVENGQEVTIKLNGKTYTAQVQDNAWTVDILAIDAANLVDGNRYLQVSVTNANGNGASSIHEFDVDSAAPTLKINTISADDILNATEQGKALVISGSSNAEVGKDVTVTLNGKTYAGAINSDGVWSITVPSSDLGLLTDGDITVSATVKDKAGNETTTSKDITVDTLAPSVTINNVTADNIINGDESKAGVIMTGTSDAEAGSKVVLTFNDRNYEATVQSDGTWSVNVPPNHLAGLMQGDHDISVTVTDNAGNSSTETSTVAVEVDPPIITIDTFAKDNYVNIAEHELTQTISGTSDAIGQPVTVILNGKTYTATVDLSGNWALDVPTVDMQALVEGQGTISASVNGALGNSNSAIREFEVDLSAPTAVINVDMITQDTGVNTTTGEDEINGDFRTSDNHFTLSGSTSGTLASNDTLQVSLDGGKSWSNLDLVNGDWSLTNTSALLDGMYTYYFRVVDVAGNAGKVVTKTVTVDTETPDHNVTINGYEDDIGIYQSDELGLFGNGSYTDDQSVLLQGTLDKEISAQLADSGVIRIYNGSTLLGVATVNGTQWSFLVENLAEGSHNLKAVVVDLVGNEGEYSQEFVINVDLTAPTLTATIDSYIDNVDTATNNAEVTLTDNMVTNDTLPLLHGTLSGAIAATDTVRVYDGLGNFIGTAIVNGTNWSLQTTVPLTEGDNTFKVCVVDAAGNHGTYSNDFTITLDTTPPTQIATINSYIDNFDNGDYQTGEFLTGSHTNDTTPELQGTLSAALAADEVLRIYQDGKYIGNATVNADLTWNYLIDNDLVDAEYNFTAVVSDGVGNEGTWSNEFNLTVDTVPPTTGAVTVNGLTTADSTPTITGTVSGISDGYRLQVKVDGVLYTHGEDDELTVSGNNWSLRIPTANALNANGTVDAAYEVEARIADLAGLYYIFGTTHETITFLQCLVCHVFFLRLLHSVDLLLKKKEYYSKESKKNYRRLLLLRLPQLPDNHKLRSFLQYRKYILSLQHIVSAAKGKSREPQLRALSHGRFLPLRQMPHGSRMPPGHSFSGAVSAASASVFPSIFVSMMEDTKKMVAYVYLMNRVIKNYSAYQLFQ